MKCKNISILQELKYKHTRKRGSFTIPERIGEISNLEVLPSKFGYLSSNYIPEYFINYYRLPYNSIYFKYSTPILIYIMSKEQLKIENKYNNFHLKLFTKYKNIITSNGFMYSKYFNMNYYPDYFYKFNYDFNLNKPKFKYGIYNRLEYNEKIIIKNLPENIKKNLLILGEPIDEKNIECTYNTKYFFENIETYLVHNCQYDAVSHVLLEALYTKKKLKILNQFQVANDNLEIIKAYNYFEYTDFFKKIDSLLNYCWKDIKNTNDFETRYHNIQMMSKNNLISFLENF